ncbi:MAG: transcription elongation factor GreA [Chloroflexi bacterium]|nr:transcription elongation factor GreA [Chloroflexota bacterium]
MTDKPTYLTAEGKRKLEQELQYLRTVRRPEIAKQIHEAKEGGDIMENAGYDEAKNMQAFVEGRIMTLEALLNKVQIIEEPGQGDVVCLGSRVTVMERGGSPEIYHIVGPAEADPRQGRISDESPLGRSLLGHRVGDWVTVRTPDGPIEFEILAIG